MTLQKSKMQKANFDLHTKGGEIPISSSYSTYMGNQFDQLQKVTSFKVRTSNVSIGEKDQKLEYVTEQNR
jgi:hypothetical protein